jgi:flagellar motor switch protein FliG
MIKDINNLSGLDKAGLLFQILGESLALTLFNDLSESDLLKVRIRSKELRHVPISLKKEIVEEFYFKLLSNQNKHTVSESSDALFDFLNKLDDEQLYYLLINESSRVIALGIDQVSDDKKQSFFNRLEDPIQKNEIIMEIGNLDNIPLEAVVTIAQDLQQKVAFLPAPKKFSRGGGESMAKILSQMDADEAQQYLDQIQGEDPDLYEAIKQYYLTFDDLLEMPEHLMKDFWMSPDIVPDVLARALRSYDEETVNTIIEFLPKRKQAMFTPIEQPIAKKEIRTSRANLVTIARKMVDDGEFSMDDIFGQEELE